MIQYMPLTVKSSCIGKTVFVRFNVNVSVFLSYPIKYIWELKWLTYLLFTNGCLDTACIHLIYRYK